MATESTRGQGDVWPHPSSPEYGEKLLEHIRDTSDRNAFRGLLQGRTLSPDDLRAALLDTTNDDVVREEIAADREEYLRSIDEHPEPAFAALHMLPAIARLSTYASAADAFTVADEWREVATFSRELERRMKTAALSDDPRIREAWAQAQQDMREAEQWFTETREDAPQPKHQKQEGKKAESREDAQHRLKLLLHERPWRTEKIVKQLEQLSGVDACNVMQQWRDRVDHEYRFHAGASAGGADIREEQKRCEDRAQACGAVLRMGTSLDPQVRAMLESYVRDFAQYSAEAQELLDARARTTRLSAARGSLHEWLHNRYYYPPVSTRRKIFSLVPEEEIQRLVTYTVNRAIAEDGTDELNRILNVLREMDDGPVNEALRAHMFALRTQIDERIGVLEGTRNTEDPEDAGVETPEPNVTEASEPVAQEGTAVDAEAERKRQLGEARGYLQDWLYDDDLRPLKSVREKALAILPDLPDEEIKEIVTYKVERVIEENRRDELDRMYTILSDIRDRIDPSRDALWASMNDLQKKVDESLSALERAAEEETGKAHTKEEPQQPVAQETAAVDGERERMAAYLRSGTFAFALPELRKRFGEAWYEDEQLRQSAIAGLCRIRDERNMPVEKQEQFMRACGLTASDLPPPRKTRARKTPSRS